jgi:hypothetical protein
MSKWSDGCTERVQAAVTIARFGETDKDLLKLVREQKEQ